MAILINGKKVAGLGTPGANGKSAYQTAKENGYTGTEQEFNQSLGKLNELFISVSEGKSLVAAAVTGKGVETAADASFHQMADNIAAIPSGATKNIYELKIDASMMIGTWFAFINESGNIDFGFYEGSVTTYYVQEGFIVAFGDSYDSKVWEPSGGISRVVNNGITVNYLYQITGDGMLYYND